MVFVVLGEDKLDCHGHISVPELGVTALARCVTKNAQFGSVTC